MSVLTQKSYSLAFTLFASLLLLGGVFMASPAHAANEEAASVRPSCQVSFDKKVYTVGDAMKVTWKTTGAESVQLRTDLYSDISQSVANSGSLTITAGEGHHGVEVDVLSSNGQTVSCSKSVYVLPVGSTKVDAKIAALRIKEQTYYNQINKLYDQRYALDQKINDIYAKIDELRAEIETAAPVSVILTVDVIGQSDLANMTVIDVEDQTKVSFSWASGGTQSCTLYREGSKTKLIKGSLPVSGTLKYTIKFGKGEEMIRVFIDCTNNVALNLGNAALSSVSITKKDAVVPEPEEPVPPIETANYKLQVEPDSLYGVLYTGSDSTNEDDAGVFTLTFFATAYDGALYIPKSATRNASRVSGVNFRITDGSGNPITTGETSSVALNSNAGMSDGYFVVPEGESKAFTLSATYDPSVAGSYAAQLLRVNWNAAAASPNAYTATKPYTSFESESVSISN